MEPLNRNVQIVDPLEDIKDKDDIRKDGSAQQFTMMMDDLDVRDGLEGGGGNEITYVDSVPIECTSIFPSKSFMIKNEISNCDLKLAIVRNDPKINISRYLVLLD